MGPLIYVIVAIIITSIPRLVSYTNIRLNALRLIRQNAPDKLVEINNLGPYKIEFQDNVRNCEDLVVVPDHGVVVLSCDPGRDYWNDVMGTFINSSISGKLWQLHYAQGDKLLETPQLAEIDLVGMPSSPAFHPLGIEYYEPTNTLYVIDKAVDGPYIRIFEYLPSESKAVLKQSLKNEMIHTPNALVAISPTELYVTNDHHIPAKQNRFLSRLEGNLGTMGSYVAYVDFNRSEYLNVAYVPFANGITLVNGSDLIIAATSSTNLYQYRIDFEYMSIAFRGYWSVDYFPDNISHDEAGNVLVAGHPHPPSLEAVSQHLHEYDMDGSNAKNKKPADEAPKAPSAVGQINVKGAYKDLYVGLEFGSASAAARDARRGIGFIVGLYQKGVLIWRGTDEERKQERAQIAEYKKMAGLWNDRIAAEKKKRLIRQEEDDEMERMEKQRKAGHTDL